MTKQIPTYTSTDELVEWLVHSPNLSEGIALIRSRDAFIDTVGCCLAGAYETVANKVFEAVCSSHVGACSVFGREEKLSAEMAALINGTAAHALDFDDNFNPAVTHASAILVPAILALGEEIGASGNELLDAYIVGLEIQAWLGRQMIPTHYSAGWHATSTIGAIGVAGACSRILKLDIEYTLYALSIATSMAGGSKLQFGTMVKPLHAGLAARAGITSAKLAAAGIKASKEPFSGAWGFVELHNGKPHNTTNRENNLVPELAIVSYGLAQKRFPCCASAHRTMDAILFLMSEYSLKTDEIERLETFVPDYDYQNMRFDRPTDEMEARFSMSYCAAVTALYGRAKLSDFTKMAVTRPEVSNWLYRVTMHSMGEKTVKETSIWEIPAVTTLLLQDGRRLEKHVLQPVGTIHTPMREEDKVNKFRDCTEKYLPEWKIGELYRRLMNLKQQNIYDIVGLMT